MRGAGCLVLCGPLRDTAARAGLRMARIPPTAKRCFVASRCYAMELKNAHVEVASATRLAVIEGKCPSCYRGIPLRARFRRKECS